MAALVERRVRRFACPWYRRRSFRLFRDQSTLAAEPSLWAAVSQALDRSRYLIVLASPHAAASPWVDREIRHWLSWRDTGSIILVRSSGTLLWNTPSADRRESADALPPALREAYAAEPLYVDLGSVDRESTGRGRPPERAVAQIAARLRGVELDRILGDDLRAHRRTRQVIAATTLALLALTAAGIINYRQAARERAAKEQRGRTALSRRLADRARAALAGRDDRAAVLLGLAALHSAETDEAHAAMLESLWASRHLVAQIAASTSPVGAVALGPGGRSVITGDNAGDVAFWDLEPPTFRGRARVHPGGVSGLAVSARAAASVGPDSEVVLWDLDSRNPLPLRGAKAFSVAFTAGGDSLVTGGEDGQVTLWNVAARQVERLRAHAQDGTIVSVATEPSGRWLVTGGLFGIARLWELPGLRTARTFDPSPATGAFVDLSPDARTVLLAGGRAVKLWDVAEREPFDEPEQSPSVGIGAARFVGPHREIAVAVGSDLFAWHIDRRRLGFHGKHIHSLTIDRARRLLVTGGADGLVRVWALAPTDAFVKSFPIESDDLAAEALALSADGRYLLVGASDQHFDFAAGSRVSTRAALHAFDISSGAPIGPPRFGHRGAILGVAFSLDDARLASASADGTVRLWARDSSEPEVIISGAPGHRALDVAFTEAGALAIAFEGEPARVVDQRGATLAMSAVSSVTTLDAVDRDRIVLGTERGEVILWSADDRSEIPLRSAPPFPTAVARVRSSARGVVVALLSDGTVELFDLASRSQRTLAAQPHRGPMGLAAGPKWMLTGSGSGKVTVWDLATRRAITDLQPGSEAFFDPILRDVAAAARADRVAAIVDGIPTVVDLDPSALARRGCEIAERPLTPEEWRDLVAEMPYEELCPRR